MTIILNVYYIYDFFCTFIIAANYLFLLRLEVIFSLLWSLDC